MTMARHGGSKIAVMAAVAGNLAVAVTKFVAAAITGSSAMISEGIHSIVDTGNGLLLLLGMKRAAASPDRRHPFGHGKDLYFYTLVVAVSIFGIGGGMSLYEGISHIRHVAPLDRLADPTMNYIVLGLAFIIESTSFSIAFRQFRKARGKKRSWQFIKDCKDPSLFAVVLEDWAAMIGLGLAFLGVFFGHLFRNPYLDGAASITIGFLLMGVAFVLATETKGLLIGEGADDDVLAEIRRIVEADEDVRKAGDILTMYIGPDNLLVNIGVQFKRGTPDAGIHAAIRRIETAISKTHPECRRVYIEAESIPAPAPGIDE
ncbi:MAG: cation diffusion facilitator family transporter [Candidatus Aminicenantales bacterium]